LQSREKEGKNKIKIEERRNKEGMNGHKAKERINDEREDWRNKKKKKENIGGIEGKRIKRKSKR
jgi:hypothetical protein